MKWKPDDIIIHNWSELQRTPDGGWTRCCLFPLTVMVKIIRGHTAQFQGLAIMLGADEGESEAS